MLFSVKWRPWSEGVGVKGQLLQVGIEGSSVGRGQMRFIEDPEQAQECVYHPLRY